MRSCAEILPALLWVQYTHMGLDAYFLQAYSELRTRLCLIAQGGPHNQTGRIYATLNMTTVSQLQEMPCAKAAGTPRDGTLRAPTLEDIHVF